MTCQYILYIKLYIKYILLYKYKDRNFTMDDISSLDNFTEEDTSSYRDLETSYSSDKRHTTGSAGESQLLSSIKTYFYENMVTIGIIVVLIIVIIYFYYFKKSSDDSSSAGKQDDDNFSGSKKDDQKSTAIKAEIDNLINDINSGLVDV